MSEIDQTLSEVSALFALVPGCELRGSTLQDDHVIMELLVEHRGALAALSDISMAANAALEPSAVLRSVLLRNESPSWPVRLTLSPVALPTEGIAHGNLQLVGVHLVWHLHRAGLMTGRDSNRMLQRWNAALVADT
jgi:hypothetical protein